MDNPKIMAFVLLLWKKQKHLFNSLTLRLVERVADTTILQHDVPNSNTDPLEVLEAFSVFFQNKDNCYIPRSKANHYAKLLGLKVQNRFIFTFQGITNSRNYHDIRKKVINFLRRFFKDDIDKLALLEYLIILGKGYSSGNLVKKDFALVGMSNILGAENKPIFTFNQGRCIVCVVIINDNYFIVAHYVRDQYDVLLSNLTELLKNKQVDRVRCYVISHEPQIDAKRLRRQLEGVCLDIDLYCHGKSKNIEDLYNYHIKVTPEDNSANIYCSKNCAMEFHTQKLSRRYCESGVEMVKTSPYKQMEFLKVD